MRRLPLALLLGGIGLGIAAEWVSYDDVDPAPWADFAVGAVLVLCGALAWGRRPESRVGALMWLSGLTWFLGTLSEPLLYLHRGPLVHLLLSYPSGRLSSRYARAVVVIAYVDAAIAPLASNDWLTLALGGAVAGAAVHTFRSASGPARAAARVALAAVLAVEAVLVLGAVDRLAAWDADRAVLWGYGLAIASAAIVLAVDLLRARWNEAVVTGLVVDLGAAQDSGSLRTTLARSLGDPSLVVGYRLPETETFVDEVGLPLELPPPGSGRAQTTIDDRGEQVAVLVHDETLLADPKLLESVAAAARIAVANAALQAETRAQAEELKASRRRLVEAADAQRRRLEEDLRLGAERRLDRVRTLLAGARTKAADDAAPIETLETELDDVRRDLREFAHGIHPAVLSEGGLKPALALLAERSPIPVKIKGHVERLSESAEVTLYFVCSEALTNVAKHAHASQASIELQNGSGRVSVLIADDGVGGASMSRGSGLRGLTDRLQALGGRLTIESPQGVGTRVVAELPRTVSAPASRA
jgi:signal transduction histidine kinase